MSICCEDEHKKEDDYRKSCLFVCLFLGKQLSWQQKAEKFKLLG